MPPAVSAAGDAWLEVHVAAPAGEAAELASEALFAAGASGIEERAPLADGRVVLVAYIPPERVPLDALPLAAAGAAVTASRRLPARDWEAEWRASLAPVPLGERLVVVPPDAAAPPPAGGRLPIFLAPGSAFGSGTHPTTALSAAAIEVALSGRAPGASVLDAGTGSGILAIAAGRLGARPVLAIDNDPEAVAEARRNAARNDCAPPDFTVSDEPLGALERRFDVVIANLDAPALAAVGPALAARVAPGGDLIISGLREGETWPAPAPPAAQLVATARRDGWRCERYRFPW